MQLNIIKHSFGHSQQDKFFKHFQNITIFTCPDQAREGQVNHFKITTCMFNLALTVSNALLLKNIVELLQMSFLWSSQYLTMLPVARF